MKNKFIIQVAPLVPLPVLRTQVFSYWNDEILPVGTLVSAPFYFREIQGIVIGSKKNILSNNTLKLKNIYSILEKNFLSVKQVELAQKISEYYFTPLGSVLKLMIPKIVKVKEKKREVYKKISRTNKIDEISQIILKSNKNKFLLFGSGGQREKINVDLIRVELKKKKQCLILAPEIFLAQNIYEKFLEIFSEEVALVHSRITKGKYYGYWEKIKSGEIKIVIATKQGIFLPFSDLGLIIVEEEQDPSFKQWESMPRYNGVRGAEFLGDLTEAKFILESSSPSAESYYRAKKREFEIVEAKDKKDFPRVEIIALESGKKNPDFPISGELYSQLAEILKNKKQAVIFMNRRGYSTRSICENCKRTLKCPKCELALVFSEEQGEYRCLHCAYKMDLLSACPACGGFQFSHRGIGTQTVQKKIERLFPNARVARLDADTLRSSKKSRIVSQKFVQGEIDILVGTQSVIKGINSPNIKLAASISGRDFADGIEYNSRSLAVSRFFHMANLLGPDGYLTVQTFFGGNPLFGILEKYDWKKYLDRELLARKRFFYPPFRKFVKLAYRDSLERKAETETKKTFDLLRATGNNMVEIVGSYGLASEKKRGLYQRNILLKFSPEKNMRDLPTRSVIGALRKGWSVDVEPVSLF